MRRYRTLGIVAATGVALVFCGVSIAFASLLGTTPTPPGGTVIPGDVTGQPSGTLFANGGGTFVSSLGTDSGTLVSAAYLDSGGTLDFYYQITSNLTASNCGHAGQPACDPIARETNTTFTGYSTATGFRSDGATLPGGLFVNGTVAPITADRNSVGNVVGFSLFPPDSGKIQPGQASYVLVISTNAMATRLGKASVIDGGVATVNALEPTGSPVPEPGSMILLGTGMLGLAGMRRARR